MAAQTESAQLGIAFALVCLAGLCAPLGASVVLFMKKSQTPLLAGSIALAAGVMVFISLTEVLFDSMEELQTSTSWTTLVRHLVTYAAFFGGVVLCRALDWFADALMALVSKATGHGHHHVHHHNHNHRRSTGTSTSSTKPSDSALQLCSMQLDSSAQKASALATAAVGTSPGSQHKGDVEDGTMLPASDLIRAHDASAPTDDSRSSAGDACTSVDNDIEAASLASSDLPEDAHDRAIVVAVEQLAASEDDGCGHLVRTSILVWLALSLHNLPEGLATIVGYMSSPHLGVTVAVAIAIHNIPEGIALGVPLFFATGSRLKAIGWAAASGLAEPLGALIGLALQLTGRLNPVAMGIIMACVAGVMTGIAFQELLPRALSFDPSNKYTTHGVFTGMAVMALSLVLLSIWDTST